MSGICIADSLKPGGSIEALVNALGGQMEIALRQKGLAGGVFTDVRIAGDRVVLCAQGGHGAGLGRLDHAAAQTWLAARKAAA